MITLDYKHGLSTTKILKFWQERFCTIGPGGPGDPMKCGVVGSSSVGCGGSGGTFKSCQHDTDPNVPLIKYVGFCVSTVKYNL